MLARRSLQIFRRPLLSCASKQFASISDDKRRVLESLRITPQDSKKKVLTEDYAQTLLDEMENFNITEKYALVDDDEYLEERNLGQEEAEARNIGQILSVGDYLREAQRVQTGGPVDRSMFSELDSVPSDYMWEMFQNLMGEDNMEAEEMENMAKIFAVTAADLYSQQQSAKVPPKNENIVDGDIDSDEPYSQLKKRRK